MNKTTNYQLWVKYKDQPIKQPQPQVDWTLLLETTIPAEIVATIDPKNGEYAAKKTTKEVRFEIKEL